VEGPLLPPQLLIIEVMDVMRRNDRTQTKRRAVCFMIRDLPFSTLNATNVRAGVRFRKANLYLRTQRERCCPILEFAA